MIFLNVWIYFSDKMYFLDRTLLNRVNRQLFQQPKSTLENVDRLTGLGLDKVRSIVLADIVVVSFIDNWRVSLSRRIHALIFLRIFSLKSVQALLFSEIVLGR